LRFNISEEKAATFLIAAGGQLHHLYGRPQIKHFLVAKKITSLWLIQNNKCHIIGK
jgi:hypothetical protein